MRVDTTNFLEKNLSRNKKLRAVIEQAFDKKNGDLQYFTSHDDCALPNGVISQDDDFTYNEHQIIERASGQAANDFYGGSISFSSDGTIYAASAPAFDGTTDYGVGYVEVREWDSTLQQYGDAVSLTASGITSADHFGLHIKVSGNGTYIFVGASEDNASVSEGGAIYVFQKTGSPLAWAHIATITPTGLASGDKFSFRFDASYDGLTVLGCSPFEGTDRGEAYIFEATAADWSAYDESVLAPSTRTNNYEFAIDCALSGNGKIAFITEANASDRGKVYYFIKKDGTWPTTENGAIRPADSGTYDRFGFGALGFSTSSPATIFKHYSTPALATNYDGDILFAGANLWQNNDGYYNGCVYYFRYDTEVGAFIQQQRLEPDTSENQSYLFGASIACNIDATRLIVGSQSEHGTVADSGYSYLFQKGSDGLYAQLTKISADTEQANEYNGYAVAITGNGKLCATGGVNWNTTSISPGVNVGRVYIVDVGAAVAYTGVIAGISGVSQQINPIKATSSIGGGHYTLIDKSGDISTLFSTKRQQGRDWRHNRVRVYIGYEGLNWDDYRLVYTQIATNISQDQRITIQHKDIQRSTVKYILDPIQMHLTSSIGFSDISIPIDNDYGLELVEHGTSYTVDPSETCTYVRIDKEVIKVTGISPTSLTVESASTTNTAAVSAGDTTLTVADATSFPSSGVGYIQSNTSPTVKNEIRWTGKSGSPETILTGVSGIINGFSSDSPFVAATVVAAIGRGSHNTRADEHKVDSGATTKTKKVVEEFIYMEEPCLLLAYKLLHGSYSGVSFPKHWHLNIDTDWLATSQFILFPDLWDSSDYSKGRILRFSGQQKVDGKSFIDQRIMQMAGCYLKVLNDGQLGVKRMTRVLSNASHVRTIEDKDIIRTPIKLKHDTDQVKNPFEIDWNWDPILKQFTRRDVYETFEDGDPIEIKAYGLAGSRFTRKTIKGIVDDLRDRYSGAPILLDLTCKHSLNGLEVGDIVRVKTDKARDLASNSPLEIDRAFEVQRVKVGWLTGNVQLKLFGSSKAAPVINNNVNSIDEDAGDNTVLNASFYTSEGTSLDAVGGSPQTLPTTETGGVLHIDGNGTLTGNADITNSSAIYYFDSDVEIDDSITVTGTQNIQLRIDGHLQINGTLTLVGQGITGGSSPAKCTVDGDWDVSGSTLTVDSTTGFDSAGTLTMGPYGMIVTYTGKTATTFTGAAVVSEIFTVTTIQDGTDLLQAESSPSAGFIGNTKSGGGITGYTWSNQRTSTDGNQLLGTQSDAPRFNITNNSTSLDLGFTDLRGTPGRAGGNAFLGNFAFFGGTFYGKQNPGGAGADGPGAVMIVCKGLSFGPNGKIDVSGSEGSTGTLLTNGTYTVHSGSGASSHPSVVLVLFDGPDSVIPNNQITADYPVTPNLGPAADEPTLAVNVEGMSSYYTGEPKVDLDVSDTIFRYDFLEPDESSNIQEDTLITTGAPLAITITPVSDDQTTVNKIPLEISITPPSDTNFDYAKIWIRKATQTGDGQYLGDIGASDEVVYLADVNTSYIVTARSVGLPIEVSHIPRGPGAGPFIRRPEGEKVEVYYTTPSSLNTVLPSGVTIDTSTTVGSITSPASGQGARFANDGISVFDNSGTKNVYLDGSNGKLSLLGNSNIVLDSSTGAISINDSTFGNEGLQFQYNSGAPQIYAGDGADQFFKYTTAGGAVVGKDSNMRGINGLNSDVIYINQHVKDLSYEEVTTGNFTVEKNDGAIAIRNTTAADTSVYGEIKIDRDYDLSTYTFSKDRYFEIMVRRLYHCGTLYLSTGQLYNGSTATRHIGFYVDASGNIYASWANGLVQNTQDLSTTLSTSANTKFKAIYTYNNDIKFYIDDVLKHTENLASPNEFPTGSFKSEFALWAREYKTDGTKTCTTRLGELKFWQDG